jgi:glyoxylase-like metal-dependent hydrolase (beta-lactamase superfamily II)/rhodanese-related sulfurtransferase
MKVEQIYTGCLAQGAYYIMSDGEVAIIDPLREVQSYINKAAIDKAKIKYVLETHFHADFVSGHIDLAKKTGAKIVYGPNAAPNFEFYSAKDGEEIKLGKVKIRVLHTPGHTMESTCYLLIDEQDKEVALFSGDTLFIGDVGRPDLAQKVKAELTEDILAGYLYDSLRNKIMTLSDDVIVYPAHGAGSACGKKMSSETQDTLGHQKQTNYALDPSLNKKEFIAAVLDGLVAPPGYFPLNVMMNIQGYDSIDEVLERGQHALSADAFEVAANETNALILDTRDAQTFAKGFIPNSINIGIDGSFAPWVGAMIQDIKQKILLVAEEGREAEIITRLARVGYDFTVGFLQGGFDTWRKSGKEIDQISSIDAQALANIKSNDPAVKILDVRKASEYKSEHIKDVQNAPLDFINESMAAINKEQTYYVHCAGGYRSMIFISILKARGFKNLIDIKGGFKELKESKQFKITDYSIPTSLLL